MTQLNKKRLLGVNFSIGDYDQVVEIISRYCIEEEPLSVCLTPVHGIIESLDDLTFATALDSADMVLPDGQPVRWALNAIHNTKLQDRVYGPELTKRLLASFTAEFRGRLYLYGGATPEVLRDFTNYIHDTYPYVKVVGRFREPDIGKQTLKIDTIVAANPNLILVGTGCPIQEKWIVANAKKLNSPALGVGAAFSLLSGHLNMAPTSMQNMGLEWLYRLMKEPKRLWKRYLYTNSRFILELIRFKLGKS